MPQTQTLPPILPNERLADYLRRCVQDEAVNTAELARSLGIQRAALYKLLRGGEPAPSTLTRFGALSGVIPNVEGTRGTLRLLGLLEAAESGWRLLDPVGAAG